VRIRVVVLSMFFFISIFTCTTAWGLDFDFSGNFTNDNDVQLFNFSVAAPSTVTVFSSSWLTGEPPQGLDPMLGIWTSSGNLVNFQDDGGVVGSTLSNGIPYNHGTWDSYYTVALGAGDFIASITQYSNFNVSSILSDGFRYDGNPNFTFDLGYGAQPLFNGVWNGDGNDPRTNNWEFHILNVAAADAVPEPSTFLLFGAGLAGVGLLRRRFKN